MQRSEVNRLMYRWLLDEISLLFTGRKATESEHASAEKCVVEDEEDEDAAISNFAPHGVVTPDTHNSSSVQSVETTQTRDPPLAPVIPMPEPIIHSVLSSPEAVGPRPLFSTEQLGVDRRLLVNRKRQLKMYRVWMQGQFRKPLEGSSQS